MELPGLDEKDVEVTVNAGLLTMSGVQRNGDGERDGRTTAIHSRRAVCDYRADHFGADLIASRLDAAVWAPGGMNLQPWSFVILDDPEAMTACSTKAKTYLRKSATDHPELAGLQSMLATPEFDILYNASILVIICATPSDEMALKDYCLAAQNLMIAATDLSGTCWIGLSEARLNTAEGKAALGIALAFRPIAPITVGRLNGAPTITARRGADVRYVRKVLER